MKWSDLTLALAEAMHEGLQWQHGNRSDRTFEAFTEALLEVHGILDYVIRKDEWFTDLPKQ